MNYAPQLPKDKSGAPMQEFAIPRPALATTLRANGSTSSVTAFNAGTTAVEVAAITAGVGIRWAANQATSVTTSNLDNFVPAGEVRKFVVPVSIMVAQASIVGANVQNGLYPGIATIGIGVGSVLTTEY